MMMMGGMAGRTPRNSDLSPSFLVLLGLCVSMVSFAGFRLVTDASPMSPMADRTAPVGVSVASVAPPAFDDFARNRFVPSQPAVSTSSPAISDPEPAVSQPPVAAVPAKPAKRALVGATEDVPAPQFREVQHSFQTGETISKVLSDNGVTAENAEEWIKAAQRVYNLSRIFAGQRVKLNVDTWSGDLVSLQMEVDSSTSLVLRRKDGIVVATREMIEQGRRLRVVQGTIAQSFYVSAARADVPEEIISDVAEVLGWDLNFSNDLKPGATFSVFYDETESHIGPDAPPVPGRLLAVRIENKGKIHEGIYFRNPIDNSESYLNRNGQQLGRAFLRFPVAYTRISSEFAASRMHPILKRARPHNGVDLAAPTGTPVRAVADGRVEMAEWKNGLGRYVSIQHDAVFESGYGHLSRIASSIRPGKVVRQGEVIGYVGATGLATGPHLHYVMYKNGAYINPLSAAMPKARTINGVALEKFRTTVTKIDAAYAAAARAGGRLAVASAPTVNTGTMKD